MAGSASRCNYPPRQRTLTHDDRANHSCEVDLSSISRCRNAPSLGRELPVSTEKGSTLDAYMAGRPNPFGDRRSTAKGWSIYGAQRAQPVATDGKWDILENRSNRPIGSRWQPTATVSQRMVRRGSTVRVR
jgi:hypothetical protein